MSLFLINSSKKLKVVYRSLAQLVEQLAFNQFVEGSNPSRPTTFDYLQQLLVSYLKNLFYFYSYLNLILTRIYS